MRLKEIEIIGFKSFMDKTNIKFEDGITVVVGPNGTGKSNISDAIKWVLGEQSAKSLRGNRMEDVIFAGTTKRKALGYCEVTIVFDNYSGKIPIEYSEVAITRRVFRSGESEYYINKRACRLKDIRELIMDTGIGKEGYSIIGQGKIEEILSNRPEDRRGIFEEASGIVKHKSKKEESEKKLRRTEDNLVRVHDIISELSRREKELSIQSKKANKYLEIYSELKGLEVNLYVHEIDIIEKELKSNKKSLDELNIKIEKNKRESEIKNEGIKNKKEDLEENQNKLELLNQEKFELIKSKNMKENSISLLEERKKYSNRELKRIRREIEETDENIVYLNKESQELKKYLEKEQSDYEKLFNLYGKEDEEFRKQLDEIENLEVEVQKMNKDLMESHSRASEYKSEIRNSESLRENLSSRIDIINKTLEKHEEESSGVKNIYKEKNAQWDLKKQNLEKLKQKSSQLATEVQAYRVKLDNISNELNSNNVNLETYSSNYRLYKRMEESYEGYYKGVRSILKAADRNKEIQASIVGVVADLIKVDKLYELAINIALGGRAQNVVTKTQKDAKRIIDYLRNNRLGRITCLPHDTIRGGLLSINEDLRREYNICGLGSELVEFEEGNRNIIENLLGRVAIVPNMDDGIALSNRLNNSIRIVTLKGDVINPGGSMSGGSQDNSINLFSRKNKLISLEKKIKSAREKAKKLALDKEDCQKHLDDFLMEKNQVLAQVQEEEYSVLNLKNEIDNLSQDINRGKNFLDESERELAKLKDELSLIDEKIKENNKKLNETLENKKNIDVKILGSSEKLKALKKIREDMNYQTTESRVILNRKKDELDSKKNTLEDNLKELERLKDFKVRKKSRIEKIERELVSDEKEILELKACLEQIQEEEKALEDRITSISNNIKAFRKDLDLEDEAFRKLNQLVDLDSREKNKVEIQIAKKEVQLETYINSLLEDYNMEYPEALKYKEDSIDLEESRKVVRNLNDSIKKLGNVNLDSIEEYEELLTRLDFMNKQVEDLKKAEKDLRVVIRDIEKEMKAKFLESFNIIDKNFQKVFSILFDGGKSRIILTDPDNVLESGIDIEVEPPGKRLQNIMLLSGGEKSLTAVALLFAILEMKPSPFCILDEIDAALDEANIGRYKLYLESISEETQFIIITHRKATMEMADMLYGVTMEERGVSKLLAVELKDYDEIEDKLLQG